MGWDSVTLLSVRPCRNGYPPVTLGPDEERRPYVLTELLAGRPEAFDP